MHMLFNILCTICSTYVPTSNKICFIKIPVRYDYIFCKQILFYKNAFLYVIFVLLFYYNVYIFLVL